MTASIAARLSVAGVIIAVALGFIQTEPAAPAAGLYVMGGFFALVVAALVAASAVVDWLVDP